MDVPENMDPALVGAYIIWIQRFTRGCLARKRQVRANQSAIVIQRCFRGMKGRCRSSIRRKSPPKYFVSKEMYLKQLILKREAKEVRQVPEHLTMNTVLLCMLYVVGTRCHVGVEE